MTIADGSTASADEVMNAYGSNFNDTAQLIFNAAYIGFNAKLNNTGVPPLKNVEYSVFTSDDADINYGFSYDSTNDLYKTPDIDNTEYVIIEATSFGTWTDGTNDTYVLPIASGKWLVYCDTGTDAVRRAQIHKSLWYGTDGTDQLILDFTTVTAVKTPRANDVGKQAHYGEVVKATSVAGAIGGVFTNTSTNTDCSSWSRLHNMGSGGASATWEIPDGTIKNSVTNNISDELGTDCEADENDNPADCVIETGAGAAPDAISVAIVLCVGGLTWSGSGSPKSTNSIDFYTDNSIPLMTAAGSLSVEGADDSTLIFKDTVASTDNAIAVINSTIDAASSEQISISANGGSNWTDVNNTEIARPTAGTALWRKIVITRTDLSKLDKVTEQSVKYNIY